MLYNNAYFFKECLHWKSSKLEIHALAEIHIFICIIYIMYYDICDMWYILINLMPKNIVYTLNTEKFKKLICSADLLYLL